MKSLLIAAVAAGALVLAAPAMAWTHQDCVKVDFNHPDCDKYEKPPVAPPVVPPVTPPVTPPATPPAPPVTPPVVVPPVVPPVPPVTPEAPTVERPKKEIVPNAPKRDQGERGKTEQSERNNTPAAPQAQTVSSTANGTLPYTGVPAGLLALAGVALIGTGMAVRRRA